MSTAIQFSQGIKKLAFHFQKIDDFISIATKPPVTAKLRNQLHVIRQQVDAHMKVALKAVQTKDKAIEKQLKLNNSFRDLKEQIKHYGPSDSPMFDGFQHPPPPEE